MRAWILRRGWPCAARAAVLLFGQVVAAAHACPAGAPDAMDPAQPLLCKAHCQSDNQTVNSAPSAAGRVGAVLPEPGRPARLG